MENLLIAAFLGVVASCYIAAVGVVTGALLCAFADLYEHLTRKWSK